ncbi:hypothetical protein M427DRAFT_133364 [Gonapodya prolifera JEL478]|uniref:Uncharacterized protein n=1 Tax=Gonapodya prolifera (strain JEL478) TaxID=1344416 RepID=A0A139ALV6_GONPJ|nr:hypothetical protein M427DRAFT_133364 [Gonapodya prolifera JEL478]|eukprot:KXS17544.1 hypothetical protein M427DRAFT_133364 [Gonapodya prolifera JEL478]
MGAWQRGAEGARPPPAPSPKPDLPPPLPPTRRAQPSSSSISSSAVDGHDTTWIDDEEMDFSQVPVFDEDGEPKQGPRDGREARSVRGTPETDESEVHGTPVGGPPARRGRETPSEPEKDHDHDRELPRPVPPSAHNGAAQLHPAWRRPSHPGDDDHHVGPAGGGMPWGRRGSGEDVHAHGGHPHAHGRDGIPPGPSFGGAWGRPRDMRDPREAREVRDERDVRWAAHPPTVLQRHPAGGGPVAGGPVGSHHGGGGGHLGPVGVGGGGDSGRFYTPGPPISHSGPSGPPVGAWGGPNRFYGPPPVGGGPGSAPLDGRRGSVGHSAAAGQAGPWGMRERARSREDVGDSKVGPGVGPASRDRTRSPPPQTVVGGPTPGPGSTRPGPPGPLGDAQAASMSAIVEAARKRKEEELRREKEESERARRERLREFEERVGKAKKEQEVAEEKNAPTQREPTQEETPMRAGSKSPGRPTPPAAPSPVPPASSITPAPATMASPTSEPSMSASLPTSGSSPARGVKKRTESPKRGAAKDGDVNRKEDGTEESATAVTESAKGPKEETPKPVHSAVPPSKLTVPSATPPEPSLSTSAPSPSPTPAVVPIPAQPATAVQVESGKPHRESSGARESSAAGGRSRKGVEKAKAAGMGSDLDVVLQSIRKMQAEMEEKAKREREEREVGGSGEKEKEGEEKDEGRKRDREARRDRGHSKDRTSLAEDHGEAEGPPYAKRKRGSDAGRRDAASGRKGDRRGSHDSDAHATSERKSKTPIPRTDLKGGIGRGRRVVQDSAPVVGGPTPPDAVPPMPEVTPEPAGHGAKEKEEEHALKWKKAQFPPDVPYVFEVPEKISEALAGEFVKFNFFAQEQAEAAETIDVSVTPKDAMTSPVVTDHEVGPGTSIVENPEATPIAQPSTPSGVNADDSKNHVVKIDEIWDRIPPTSSENSYKRIVTDTEESVAPEIPSGSLEELDRQLGAGEPPKNPLFPTAPARPVGMAPQQQNSTVPSMLVPTPHGGYALFPIHAAQLLPQGHFGPSWISVPQAMMGGLPGDAAKKLGPGAVSGPLMHPSTMSSVPMQMMQGASGNYSTMMKSVQPALPPHQQMTLPQQAHSPFIPRSMDFAFRPTPGMPVPSRPSWEAKGFSQQQDRRMDGGFSSFDHSRNHQGQGMRMGSPRVQAPIPGQGGNAAMRLGTSPPGGSALGNPQVQRPVGQPQQQSQWTSVAGPVISPAVGLGHQPTTSAPTLGLLPAVGGPSGASWGGTTGRLRGGQRPGVRNECRYTVSRTRVWRCKTRPHRPA